MGWTDETGKHFGKVCATHDKLLGRTNLVEMGMNTEQAILFERYLKETVDLEEFPDFPEWLTHGLAGKIYIPLKGETHLVENLNLSPATHNALRRNSITSIEVLASMGCNELLKIHRIGAKGLREIQKALKEFKGG